MSEWQKLNTTAPIVGVDRDNSIIHGMVVAQLGPFKSVGRGEFDERGLKSIVKLMKGKALGLKSRFTHPDESNDGLGKMLGRVKNGRMSTAVITRDGTQSEIPAVRGDLHISPTSRTTPNGDLGGYVMDLAEEDPDALSSSLVLTVDEEYRLNKDGTPKVDDAGNPLPPLWRPKSLHASDIVDTGDAVDSLLGAKLSAEGMPHDVLQEARRLMAKQFKGKSREFVEERLADWQNRVLEFMYSTDDAEPTYGTTDVLTRVIDIRNR